ncbi:Metallo-dependent phosphatase-like protein, partial [Piptocephalis cylindrospora]
MDDAPSNLFTFIHISDIHVSRFHKAGGRAHLAHFLRHTLRRHGPAFVVATGDLTDAKDQAQMGGRQDEGEWQAYRGLLQRAGVLDRRNGDFWRDLRGNHDCFSVPTWTSPANHFPQYSASGKAAWSAVEDMGFGQYGFIAVDGCPDRGATRMLNFFGLLPRPAMTTLARQVDELAPITNHTFFLSHYPASTTRYAHAQDGRTFGDLAAKGISLGLCGHLHRLAGGLGDRLQAYHAAGDWLELELPDLKLTSSYRVIAVDHDMISYTDNQLFPLGQPLLVDRTLEEDRDGKEKEIKLSKGADSGYSEPPVVLITNPKEASLILPHKEPIWRIQKSTHIRALVWPGEGRRIVRVMAHIPGKEPVEMHYSGKGSQESWEKEDGEGYLPLWTVAWNPKELGPMDRVHSLLIRAEDDTGVVGEGSVEFRVDGAREPLDAGWLSHWVIHANFDKVIPLAFLSIYLPIMILLLLARCSLPSQNPQGFVSLRGRELKVAWSSSPSSFFNALYMAPRIYWHRAQAIACTPKFFLPIFVYGLLLPIAPWYGGDIFAGQGPQRAWVYLMGAWVEGRWVPVLDTWAQGWVGLALSWVPV